MNRSDVIRLTEEIGFLPESKFGQNFLCDDDISHRIVDLCELHSGDSVLEIGPGLGSLTSILAGNDISLTAVEIDKRLAEYISNTYDCNVISRDYTKLKSDEYNASDFDVAVSNIPYYLMTPIMKKLMTDLRKSRKMVLMVEKDALERILAKPKTKQYGPLAVLCNNYGSIKTEFDLPGNLYYPVPKTTSTVITLTRSEDSFCISSEYAAFLDKCFSNRRKKLLNNVNVSKEKLHNLGYSDTVRAEEIRSEDFIKLYVV